MSEVKVGGVQRSKRTVRWGKFFGVTEESDEDSGAGITKSDGTKDKMLRLAR